MKDKIIIKTDYTKPRVEHKKGGAGPHKDRRTKRSSKKKIIEEQNE